VLYKEGVMMRLSGGLLLCLLLAYLSPQAAETRKPGDFFFQQTLGDFSEELETARRQGKQGVLLFFEMDDCPFCLRMKETVLNRSDVQDFFRRHFLIFAVDVEGETEITDFDGRVMLEREFAFNEHRVRATPVFAFFDLQGNRVVRYTGATRDAREFLWLGEYVLERAWERTNFTLYKQSRRESAATDGRAR